VCAESLLQSQKPDLYQACLFQRLKRSISRNRLERARAEFHRYIAIQLRYPDSLRFEVRQKQTRCVGCHMSPDTPFFLGQTASVYDVALCRLRPSNATFSRHSAFFSWRVGKIRGFAAPVKVKLLRYDAHRVRFAEQRTCATVASA